MQPPSQSAGRAPARKRLPLGVPAAVLMVLLAALAYWKWGFEERVEVGEGTTVADLADYDRVWLGGGMLRAAALNGTILTVALHSIGEMALPDSLAEYDFAAAVVARPSTTSAIPGASTALVSWTEDRWPQAPRPRLNPPVSRRPSYEVSREQVAQLPRPEYSYAVGHDASRVAWIPLTPGKSALFLGEIDGPGPAGTRRETIEIIDATDLPTSAYLRSRADTANGGPPQIALTASGTLALYYPDGRLQVGDRPSTLVDLPGVGPSQEMDVVGNHLVFRHVPDRGFPARASVTVIDPRQANSARIVYQSGEEGFPDQKVARSPRELLPVAISPAGTIAVGTPTGEVRINAAPGGAPQPDSLLVAPGAVLALTFLAEGELLVAGEFRGIHLLAGGQDREIGPAPIGTAFLALDDATLVYGGSGPFNVAQLRTSRVPTSRGVVLPVMALAVGLGALVGLRRPAAVPRSAASEPREPIPTFLRPGVPDELATACAKGQCVVYAGAGLSAGAGYPLWKPFIEGLVTWVAEQELIPPTMVTTYRQALEKGETASVVDGVVSLLEYNGHGAALQEYLKQQFLTRKSVTKVHRALRNVGFQAALTPNFDTLLERTFDNPPSPVYTPRDAEPLLSALSQRSFFIAKLYGDLERSPAMVSPAQYRAAVANNLPFAQFNQQLFYSRTVFFCGCSLSGILDYLQGASITSTPDRKHYALVAIEESGWEVSADLLGRRYGIQVLPFTPTAGFPEVTAFAEELVTRTAEAREQLVPEDTAHPAAIKRITLQNIGAFKEMSLDLDPGLTVLLGDNGVGKSTILKAAAFALAGSDQDSTAAAAFLRGAETSGSVVLETFGGASYRADILRRSDGGAQITFLPYSWLQREGKLALGFPPLRTVSAGKSRGPELAAEPPRPSPSDVLPIVTNLPDPRTTDLKQWLVNLDYRRKSGGDRTKIDRLLHDFFATLSELLEGVTVDFQDLRIDALEIKVVTDDGIVPLNALSQGTVSLIGWIGVLLQRLYEVYDRAENPREEFAIVLMDEIDAHMHPRWQQSLVGKLKHLFPNIQFVATTHSPFIVAGREPSEIVRLRRDEATKDIRIEPAIAGTKGTDVASILMSYLFGLKSPVDADTQELILRRRDLVAREALTPEDEAELDRLNKQLDGVFAASTRDPDYNAFVRARVKRQAEEAPIVRLPLTQGKREKTREILEKVKRSAEHPVVSAESPVDTEAHDRALAILKELQQRGDRT